MVLAVVNKLLIILVKSFFTFSDSSSVLAKPKLIELSKRCRLKFSSDGIVAKLLVGQVILGNKLEITTDNGRFTIGDNEDNTRMGVHVKDEVLRDERLDNLVTWYAKAKLQNISNIIFAEEENIDSTISKNTIRGKIYYSVHGDYDSYSESGINKLVSMTKEFPSCIFYGHLHHNSYDDINDIKIIRSGSFAGTGDDYTISKRINGKPSQAMCVVDETGIVSFIPVSLV